MPSDSPSSGRAALRNAGMPAVLVRAAEILEDRGLAPGVTYDPVTGEVSVEGALLLALGAKNLVTFELDPEAVGVPPRNLGLAEAALRLAITVEASDTPTAARALRDLADRIIITP